MLQYELTGVWFILTVIDIDVEFISLGKKRKKRIEKDLVTIKIQRNHPE